jgi:hypothetical protein
MSLDEGLIGSIYLGVNLYLQYGSNGDALVPCLRLLATRNSEDFHLRPTSTFPLVELPASLATSYL